MSASELAWQLGLPLHEVLDCIRAVGIRQVGRGTPYRLTDEQVEAVAEEADRRAGCV